MSQFVNNAEVPFPYIIASGVICSHHLVKMCDVIGRSVPHLCSGGSFRSRLVLCRYMLK